MAALKIVAKLAAAGEAARIQALRCANGCDRRNARRGEIAGRTESRICKRVGIALDAPDICADVKTLPALSTLPKARCGEDQNHRAASQKESVHLHLHVFGMFRIMFAYRISGNPIVTLRYLGNFAPKRDRFGSFHNSILSE